MKPKNSHFWKTKSLAEMTSAEWEAICDGCARCCLHNFQDRETGKIRHIAVACELLEIATCRCSSYEDRKFLVPNCIKLSPENLKQRINLPHTCAYRALSEGRPLKWWHPLVSGEIETVHQAGISVRNKVVSGMYIHPDDLKDYQI